MLVGFGRGKKKERVQTMLMVRRGNGVRSADVITICRSHSEISSYGRASLTTSG